MLMSKNLKKGMILFVAFIIIILRTDIAYAAVTDIQQTMVGNDTIEVSWQASGTDTYIATLYDTQGTTVASVTTTSGSAVFGQLVAGTSYYVRVVTATEATDEAVSLDSCTPVYTKPAKVSEFGVAVWYPIAKPKGTSFPGYKANKTRLEWLNDNYSDGYELVIYSLKGKKLKAYDVKDQNKTYCTKEFCISEVKNQGFIAKIRSYKVINNVSYYSEAFEKITIVPQASIKKVTGTSKKRNVYWNPVKGASKYMIYRVRNGKLKLLQTVGSKSAKATVSGLKSGDGIAVAVKVKLKGKALISPITWYISQD